jgi:nicotinamidase-related amidase
MLRNLDVDHLFITGGAATGCVSKTTREGAGLGFRLTLVEDALHPAGSPHVQEVLSKYGDIRTTTEVIEELTGKSE